MLLTVPAPAAAAPAGVADLQARLTAVTARAQRLAVDLERSRAKDGGLRRAVEDLEAAQDDARGRLAQRVREVYIATGPLPAPWRTAGLDGPAERLLAERGAAGALRVEQSLVDAVAEESDAARQLRERAERFREDLRAQAEQVLADQDEARALLAAAQERAIEQARRAEQAQQAAQAQQTQETEQLQQAAQARQAQETEQLQQAAQAQQAQQAADAAQRQVAAAEAALDEVSAVVTTALAPAVTARGRQATADAAPVLALLEATGSGYPAGYRPSGTVLRGTASWYGPGFVGSPTASGRPYDPERFSCAHKDLPLGTVVRVSANGRAVSCLVDDRGPYVGDRVLDLSRAGSRALGYDGTAEVVAEVLTPV